MYKICVRRHFDAAHALRGYRGKCENMHGHRWQIVACVEQAELDDIGLAFDFTRLKEALEAVLEDYDHHNLNEMPPFDQLNPSSEHIAKSIYERLQERLPEVKLEYVEAWESPDAWATYYPP
ncbi:MAG: 6-carboxytetrahydropterin synthase QueD [Chloroflexota bacterium]|nr:6-carboxytetrahydropterin synthase QueD [Chloroflexota bacterium]